MKTNRSILISILLIVLGCKHAARPIPIYPEDVCAVCKMAVSESRFAGEVLLPNGNYLKFDDIGCLMKYEQRPHADSIWLGDYATGEWVRADSALLLKTDSIRTPMGYGILAFANRKSFERAVNELHGKPIAWH